MASVNVTFNLPVLPDNDIWWANNAAWQEYWNSSSLLIEVAPASVIAFGVVKKADTLAYAPTAVANNDAVEIVVDGVTYQVPLLASFQELKAAFAVLNTNYQNLKAAQVAAGQNTL